MQPFLEEILDFFAGQREIVRKPDDGIVLILPRGQETFRRDPAPDFLEHPRQNARVPLTLLPPRTPPRLPYSV